jgi:hypothetical protein
MEERFKQAVEQAKKLADLAMEPMNNDNPGTEHVWEQIYIKALSEILELS